MSRKRVPLNQNECTADFRIGVPFEQNLQAELLMPYEVFRKNFFAHMNELEITPGKVRLDEAIRLIVCQMSDFLVPYVISIN